MSSNAVQENIENIVQQWIDADMVPGSRIHPVRGMGAKHSQVWVKRDDELSFGCSGSKVRKMASLLPALKRQGVTDSIVIGGLNSNNLVALLQGLRERGIRPRPLVGRAYGQLAGNRLLAEILGGDLSFLRLDRATWFKRDIIAAQWAANLSQSGRRVRIIPEGSAMMESIAGAATQALEIHREGCQWQTIVMDGGTGFQAAVTGVLLRVLGHRCPVVVVALGTDEQSLAREIEGWSQRVTDFFKIKDVSPNILLVRAPYAARFGQTNRRLMQYIRQMARVTGMLLDPVYTAKLFATVSWMLERQELTGRSLVIHSGGGSGLFGFTDSLGTVE